MTEANEKPALAERVEKTKREETTKEGLMGLIFSFALVFMFTRYVVASYVIPTASMATTLSGAHMRFWSEQTGETWAVNPWFYPERGSQQGAPYRAQGRVGNPVHVQDLHTKGELVRTGEPVRSGDRIFVLKYLYALFEPERWDVAVFKYPGDSRENWIKRIVGLPGEEVWLADGDVFTRPLRAGDEAWRIRRKPREIQRSLWREIYSSERRPLKEMHDGRAWETRWKGPGWAREGTALAHDGVGIATLTWDSTAQAIEEWLSYNDVSNSTGTGLRERVKRFPVSDLRMRANIDLANEGAMRGTARIFATLEMRGTAFRVVIVPLHGAAVIERRVDGEPDQWRMVAESYRLPVWGAGEMRRVEVWHADQRLELFVDGKRIVWHEYDWGPRERLERSLVGGYAPERLLTTPRSYERPRVSWEFVDTGKVRLHRVGLDRDLYYQPAQATGDPARGAREDDTMSLGAGEYFMLGDNSAASNDGRGWDGVDPWVRRELGIEAGVVHRDLLMGKAFFVFWPSFHDLVRLRGVNLFPPDFGRMRFIE